jgi:hypothetical protein
MVDIVSKFSYTLPGQIGQLELRDLLVVRQIVRRAIHRAAKELGITRYFVNRNGKRFLMFNAGEALRVLDWLKANRKQIAMATFWRVRYSADPRYWRWELRDGYWEAVESQFTPVPRNQLALPLDNLDIEAGCTGYIEG